MEPVQNVSLKFLYSKKEIDISVRRGVKLFDFLNWLMML